MSLNTHLAIINKTFFKGIWKYPFLIDSDSDFFTVGKEMIQMNMMYTSNASIDYFDSNEINSILAFLEYKNNFKMLIIMPHKSYTKSELVQFYKNKLNGMVLQMLISKMNKIKFDLITMPKFNITSNWYISSLDNKSNDNEIPYLNVLLDSEADFSNINYEFNNMNNICIDLKSSSQIIVDEIGTDIDSETSMYFSDSNVKNNLNINKSFIFMIMNKENIITNIGLYVG